MVLWHTRPLPRPWSLVQSMPVSKISGIDPSETVSFSSVLKKIQGKNILFLVEIINVSQNYTSEPLIAGVWAV